MIFKLSKKINKNVKYLKNNYEIKDKFFELTQKNDFIINMGAGDCHNLWSILSKKNNIFGIDVNSGLESKEAIKDIEKIETFFKVLKKNGK